MTFLKICHLKLFISDGTMQQNLSFRTIKVLKKIFERNLIRFSNTVRVISKLPKEKKCVAKMTEVTIFLGYKARIREF